LYEAVVHRAQHSRPDLVMKSPAGKHPMQRLTLDPNDWQLARTCPVPLMLTRGLPWKKPMHFAAAIDVPRPEGEGLARSVLHTAGYLAQCCEAHLDVVYSDRDVGNADERAMRTDSVRRVVNEFRIHHQHLHVLHGDPESTLPAFVAQLHCDVLVIGALTRRNSISALVGTLTSRLVDALECDFVLVKPESYSCPVVAEHGRTAGGSAGLQYLTT
jgi:universal stress protein E